MLGGMLEAASSAGLDEILASTDCTGETLGIAEETPGHGPIRIRGIVDCDDRCVGSTIKQIAASALSKATGKGEMVEENYVGPVGAEQVHCGAHGFVIQIAVDGIDAQPHAPTLVSALEGERGT